MRKRRSVMRSGWRGNKSNKKPNGSRIEPATSQKSADFQQVRQSQPPSPSFLAQFRVMPSENRNGSARFRACEFAGLDALASLLVSP